ncbi:MAG TPA: PilZ domain-containing protein [Candidatus Hydrogenedentes bacterium]|nr:PilZ domain-containing protein [Candidatus Hydrogenedentota bacterium]HIJ73899.1 PilZ domain-containing protein [Candidatus Hydrogenedentota bacterium]
MDWYVEEKRHYPRFGDNVCAWLSFMNDSAVYASLTMDLGLSGARFSTHHSVRKGEGVDLHLQLPAGAVQCSGTVCWTRAKSDGMQMFGVEFGRLTDQERVHLLRHLGRESDVSSLVSI